MLEHNKNIVKERSRECGQPAGMADPKALTWVIAGAARIT